ncbi:hypothetical protein Dimus_028670 [Dionaea muscipula]
MSKPGRPKCVQPSKTSPIRGSGEKEGSGEHHSMNAPSGETLSGRILEDPVVILVGDPVLVHGAIDAGGKDGFPRREIEKDGAWGEDNDLQHKPYLRVAQKGVGADVDARAPNHLTGNRDTRRGLQLSNEEQRDEELIFTVDDVASEREFWASTMIVYVLGDRVHDMGIYPSRHVAKGPRLDRSARPDRTRALGRQ